MQPNLNPAPSLYRTARNTINKIVDRATALAGPVAPLKCFAFQDIRQKEVGPIFYRWAGLFLFTGPEQIIGGLQDLRF